MPHTPCVVNVVLYKPINFVSKLYHLSIGLTSETPTETLRLEHYIGPSENWLRIDLDITEIHSPCVM